MNLGLHYSHANVYESPYVQLDEIVWNGTHSPNVVPIKIRMRNINARYSRPNSENELINESQSECFRIFFCQHIFLVFTHVFRNGVIDKIGPMGPLASGSPSR